MCNSCMQELHAVLAALCENYRQFKINACKNCTCNHGFTQLAAAEFASLGFAIIVTKKCINIVQRIGSKLKFGVS